MAWLLNNASCCQCVSAVNLLTIDFSEFVTFRLHCPACGRLILTEGDRLPESACTHLRYAYDWDAGFWHLPSDLEAFITVGEHGELLGLQQYLQSVITAVQFRVVRGASDPGCYVGFDLQDMLVLSPLS